MSPSLHSRCHCNTYILLLYQSQYHNELYINYGDDDVPTDIYDVNLINMVMCEENYLVRRSGEIRICVMPLLKLAKVVVGT